MNGNAHLTTKEISLIESMLYSDFGLHSFELFFLYIKQFVLVKSQLSHSPL